jgi:hypothetical protein
MKHMKSLQIFVVCLGFVLMSLPCWATDPLDVWHLRTSPTANTLWSVAYGNGTLWAVGGDVDQEGTIINSIDGTNWLPYKTLPLGSALWGVCYGGSGHFVAVGRSGMLYTDWIPRGSDTTNDLFAVQGTGNFAAAGAKGTVTTDSKDGLS